MSTMNYDFIIFLLHFMQSVSSAHDRGKMKHFYLNKFFEF